MPAIPAWTPRDLRDASWPGHRAEQGLFVAEGTTVIRRLSRRRIRALAAPVPAALDALGPDLPADVTVLVAERDVLGQVAGFDVHRGAVACARPVPPDPASLSAPPRTVAVLEGFNDPENLGAIARCAGRSGSTPCCSTRPAPTRSTGGASASRWARSSSSPGPG